jgi:ABC transport system ATP-binding/permease protein
MNYIQVDNLTKSYGDNILFNEITFSVNKDDKIALIAKNGTGKTSLLRIIAQIETADSGNIAYKRDLKIGLLPQDPQMNDDHTVIQEVYSTSNEILDAIKEYETAIQSENQNNIDAAIHKMDTLKAWDHEVRIKQILAKLNITEFDKKIGQLSGGQKKRVALASLLIEEPELFILDEPTNHLDLDMIEWLEGYLKSMKSTLLMVTHDRYFLDRVCNNIFEIENKNIYHYKGNYAYFLEKREMRHQNENTQIERAKQLLKKELAWMRRMPSARGTKAKSRIDSFYDLEEEASKKVHNKSVKLDVKTTRLGKKILELYNLEKSFGDIRILNDFTYLFKRFEKVGIIGPNGSGKTTLLNIIAGLVKIDKGKIDVGETVVFGYYTQDGIQLKDDKRVIDVIQDIGEVVTLGDGKKLSAVQFLNYFLFPKNMHYALVGKLSGGEKRRLYLMTILMQNPNFLILDEPTNDLDIMTLNVLEEYLQSFQGCVAIVSHDRYFMDKIVEHVFVFEGEGVVKDFPGNYSQFREKELKKIKEEKPKIKAEKIQKEKKTQKKFSFKEKREFEEIEKEISDLTVEKTNLEEEISSGELKAYELTEKSNRIGEVIALLEQKEERWLELSLLQEE